MTLRVLDIARGTSVDGPGLRDSIYFAGCHHACEGCHNPQSWDMNGGREMSDDEIMEILRYDDFDVTISGGDPMYGAWHAWRGASRRSSAKLFGATPGLNSRVSSATRIFVVCSRWLTCLSTGRLCLPSATYRCVSAEAAISASSTLSARSLLAQWC